MGQSAAASQEPALSLAAAEAGEAVSSVAQVALALAGEALALPQRLVQAVEVAAAAALQP